MAKQAMTAKRDAYYVRLYKELEASGGANSIYHPPSLERVL